MLNNLVSPVASEEQGRPAATSGASEFRVAVLLILLAHVSDLVSTYLASPDLAREANPVYLALAQHGWGGWPSLVGLKMVGIAGSVFLFAFYLRARTDFYPSRPGLSFHDFLHHTHGHNPIRRRDGRWVAPSLRLLCTWGAFTFAIGSATYALFLAVHNLMGTPLVYWMADAAAPGIIFMVTAFVFWHNLYSDYQRSMRETI